MKTNNIYIYSIIEIAILILSFFLNEYAVLSIALTIVVWISILDKLGRGIVLRELIAFHGCIICLIMPIVGYNWYTYNDFIARRALKYMAVSEDTYFSFILPALSAFTVLLCWPLKTKRDIGQSLNAYMIRARKVLQTKHSTGIYIMIVGLVSSIISPFLPSSLGYVSSLFYYGSFAGFLYVYYCPSFRYKKLILIGFILTVFASALATGMFTVVAYMGITMFSFLFFGKIMPLWKKMIIFLFGILFLLIIHLTKGAYRAVIWNEGGYTGNKTELYINTLIEQSTKPLDLFNQEAFFPIYLRGNQGYNIALVMKRFPTMQEFDNGDNLLNSLAAALVPRLLWPDKPKAGGEYNMAYYTGINLNGKWSTNIGPLGEAYGSFDVTGGIIFMAVLGFFIRLVYKTVFRISQRVPFLLFWLPLLFYQITYSMETDTLQILNSLLKGSFFLLLLYKVIPAWFGVNKTPQILNYN